MSNPFASALNIGGKEAVLATWQARVLRGTRGKLGHVLLQAMKNEYIGVTETSWATLLRWINRPYGYPRFVGHARVEQSGRVTSMTLQPDFSFQRVSVYRNKDEFVGDMRMVADALKLSDLERVEMFALLGRWIPEDRTVGVHGEKLAS